MNKLIIAIILTLIPITELRIGLPVAINYALENNIPLFMIFLLIVLINIILIFFVFYFLDKIHLQLMKLKFYRNSFNKFLKKIQKKIDRFEKKRGETEFIALFLLVALPFPGTGVWSGCLISWILGFDRRKSILAIGLGVLIAGIIIFSGTIGFVKLFKIFN